MLVGAVVLLVVAQALPASPTPTSRARAQALLKEGVRLYEKGALVPALEKFNAAYAEFPSPKLLFNIGQANRDMARVVDAMNAFERFLAEATDSAAAAVVEAKASVAELERKLGKLQIECATPGADISVDGKRAGQTPLAGPIWAEPGHHQVTAQKEGFVPAVEEVDVNANWVHTVVVTLQPVDKAVAQPLAEPPAPQVTAVSEASRVPAPEPSERAAPEVERSPVTAPEAATALAGRSSYTWAWVATGSAAVFAGTATILGISMKSRFDSLNRSCGSQSSSSTACSESDIDGVLLRRDLANLSWGLAAAAAVTAGVLFAVEGRPVAVAPLAGDVTGLMARMAY